MMNQENGGSKPLWKALIEIGFIIFLFYSNLMMSEFTRSSRSHSLAFAFLDIFTVTNFVIANIAAITAYVVFDFLRRKL